MIYYLIQKKKAPSHTHFNIEKDIIKKAQQEGHKQRLECIKNRSNVYQDIEKSFNRGYGPMYKSKSDIQFPRPYALEKEFEMTRQNNMLSKKIESVIYRKNQYAVQEKKNIHPRTGNLIQEDEQSRINENLSTHL